MTNFQDVFDGTVIVNDDERAALVRDWLKNEYNITAANAEALASLLEVHIHGAAAPQHFGHPLISSSFGQGIFQIVFVTGRWHLSFRKEPRTEFTLVHPKSEGPSWQNVSNRSAATEAGLILKSGSLRGAQAAPVVQEVIKPSAVIDGSNVHIHIPEVQNDDETTRSRSVDMLGGFGSTGYSSVSIDMGSLDDGSDKK